MCPFVASKKEKKQNGWELRLGGGATKHHAATLVITFFFWSILSFKYTKNGNGGVLLSVFAPPYLQIQANEYDT